ncbi:MAG: TlpA family protein disulfide reductase [Sphingobacteriaceae bacterium]|nr:MAG: TlpA family protein disulfide reductase [Sphingobacteriaceae bacterium]
MYIKRLFLTSVTLIISGLTFGQNSKTHPDVTVLVDKFFAADNFPEKKSIYQSIVTKAPEGSAAGAEVNYDELKRILAMNYLQADSIKKYEYYINGVHDKVGLANQLYKMVSHFTGSKREAAFAERPAATLVQLIRDVYKNPKIYKPKDIADSVWASQIREKEYQYESVYGLILYRQEKYQQTDALLEPVYKQLPAFNLDISDLYAKTLSKLGKTEQSITIIRKVFEAGYRSDELMATLEQNYIALHGSNNGYDSYLAGEKKIIQEKVKERLKRTMTSKAAPSFQVKDIQGNTVSLQNLKGKVVIIDFWANWCQPCKQSFPAVQTVVNNYQNDKDVKFLFVDTRESDKDYMTNAKQYITDSRYTFTVLFDEKDPKTNKQEMVANLYHVSGIPTRIIIDKKGNISFEEIGYSGSPSQMSEDLITMIELAKER